MALYPVIMCGGAGTRLWPASRPSRPKQFIPLAGNRSLFQETALRVAPLAGRGGQLIIVAGVAHREWILDQLEEVGLEAQLLLEPEPRDSAAAMAAAAAWTEKRDPDGMLAFVASDHHIPDQEAFREAVLAAADGAADGRIVTLGVKPDEPSSAYGYIKPAGDGLSAVEAFREKPDRGTAEAYIRSGYLWNSGNFIVSARTLIEELQALAPAVELAARRALADVGDAAVAVLGPEFSSAPRISIDYAVMEKTLRAAVLAVDFRWSDLGAWDSIAATGEGEYGQHILEDAEGCLVRAPEGMLVAALGVRNLAIIAEKDAILVCSLGRAQEVKRVVDRVRGASPSHLDFHGAEPEGLAAGARRLGDWLRLRALPVWGTVGQASDGGFAEALALDGRPVAAPRRARVQARQIHVFAEAGLLGWQGPWRQAVERGLDRLDAVYLRPDGRMRTTLTADSAPLDETAMVYDQAFLLLAWASAHAAGVGEDLEARAVVLREALMASVQANGALVEAGLHPHQANAHMHFLEACLAWEAVGQDAGWAPTADRLVQLALDVFVDAKAGCLREFYGADWSPAPGEDGALVEPGHQFEWAWLLARHARMRGAEAGLSAARRLYAFGLKGVESRAQVAIDALNDDGTRRSRRARLWPQTEWLKAALILAEHEVGGERAARLREAAAAQRALWLYLTPEGLWRDKRLPDGKFIDEPAPASSMYHVLAAFSQMKESLGVIDRDNPPRLDLA